MEFLRRGGHKSRFIVSDFDLRAPSWHRWFDLSGRPWFLKIKRNRLFALFVARVRPNMLDPHRLELIQNAVDLNPIFTSDSYGLGLRLDLELAQVRQR